MMGARRVGAGQRGLTLVELMIAITLGLLVMLVASALLVSANASYLHLTEAARVQDGGRYALEIMTRSIHQSAYANWDRDGDEAPLLAGDAVSANVSGLDARAVSKNGDGIGAPVADGANGSDVLALRFAGAGAGPDGDGSVINCAGFGVAAPSAAENAEQARRWSIFYVAKDADGEAELRCKYRSGAGWGADAIVRGVDSFQVLYGVDTDLPADGVANRYVSASVLNGLDAALVPQGLDAFAKARDKNKKSHWKKVVSIKIALLLHGERNSRPDSLPAQFDLFGKDYGQAYGAGDPGTRISESALPAAARGRVRHLFVSTILLRNQAH
jgi:type IV pilus assembly protein PilW